MDNTMNNFRSTVLEEPVFIGSNGADMLRTPVGNVRAMPPPPPPVPQFSQQSQYGGSSLFGGGYGGNGYGFGGGYGYGGGHGFDSGYNSYGGYGGAYGSYGTGMFNRFGAGGGLNVNDPETRFIQLAEASSRPAFQSIESLVSAIGNIAAMLDSTFFALTSSFRAILGVAANFGRLRGVFAQFWQTFAIFRGLTWIYRKILFWLRISNLDPSSQAFKKAFAEAVNNSSEQNGAPLLPRKGQSPWPVVAFISFIFTAPYLIMKLLGTVVNSAQEESRNPVKWIQPISTVALYDFQARNQNELSIRTGQRLLIAPKEVQNTQALLNTGWALATTDGQVVGIIPINYVKSPQQMRQEQQLEPTPLQPQPPQSVVALLPDTGIEMATTIGPTLPNLSTNAFPAKPMMQLLPDFEIAPQPIGAPPTSGNLS